MYICINKQTNNTVMTTTANTQIYTKRFGNVTVTRVEGNNIYFDVNGDEKMTPASLAKPAKENAAPKKSKAQKDREEIARYKQLPQHLRIQKALTYAAKMQCPSQMDYDIYEQLANEIMSKVDNAMVKSILESTNPRKITDNQAWAVAYACQEVEIANA